MNLEPIKARLAAAAEGPWEAIWRGRSGRRMVYVSGEFGTYNVCDSAGEMDTVNADLIANAPTDLAELVAFAELVLEELKKHWFNGEQKTVDECSHCGGTARDEPCWAAQLKQKLEAL